MSPWSEWVPVAQDIATAVCLIVSGAVAVVGLVCVYDRIER